MRLPSTDSDSPVEVQTPVQPKPRAPWILLLPLLLGAGIVWQQTRDTSQPDDTPPRIHRKPLHKPTPQSSGTPKPALQYSNPTTILVPGDDEKLHEKPFKNDVPAKNDANLTEAYTHWINAVVQATPELFPPGTRVQSVKVGSDAEPAQVSFNQAFAKPEFWNGETKTKMAVYSIVNTLSPVMAGKGRNVPVQILVDGKRIETLGEFDTSDPIEPDFSLNAAHSSNANNTVDASTSLNTANTNPSTEGRSNP
jgi:hypothetical protein